MIGRVLGHYRIDSKLGEGGMGVVYRALDTHLDRPVAIKVLRPDVTASPERTRRFVQEAKSASALNHPNIIHVYDIGTATLPDGPIDFIAMEFVPGKTLDQYIGRTGLPLKDTLKYSIQIADALASAHSAGIVHRDLKPANVIVADDGRVKLLDFGLAKLTEKIEDDLDAATMTMTAAEEMSQTEEGSIVGTIAYMSPEQAEGRKVDARSDIFSFGAVLYEMVSGRRPFEGATKLATLAAILHEEPPPVSQPAARLPGDLEKIIARCLRKDPDRRAQHMDDIKLALQELKEESESGKLSAGLAQASRPKPHASFRLIAIAGGLLVLLAAVSAWWLTNRSPPGQPGSGPVLTRLTNDSGFTADPALSPDGKLVAYTSDRGGPGELNIWVQQVATGERLRLTSNEADEREPAFSPDGSRIAYRSEQEGGGAYMVSSLGGESRRVAREGRRPQFSPSGEYLAYWVGGTTYQGLVQGKVYVVPVSGGQPRQIQPEFHSAAFPVWSPDGTRLLFMGMRDPGDPAMLGREMDWWTTPLTGDRNSAVKTEVFPALWRLKFGFGSSASGWIAAAAWLPDQSRTSRIVFSAGSGDAQNIWQIRLSHETWQADGEPERLTFGAGSERLPSAVALAGGRVRLAIASLNESLAIWSLPLDANRGVVSGVLERLTQEGTATRPSMSLDGRRMVYARSVSGKPSVWLRDLASGKETLLADDSANPRMSPDGNKVAYWSGGAVYTVSIAGGDPELICGDCYVPNGWNHDGTKLLDEQVAGNPLGLVVPGRSKRIPIIAHPSYVVSGARFSPDGRWIAFHVLPSPTSRRLFVVPFRDVSQPGAEPIEEKDWIPITDGAGMERYAAWSPDGNLLYFLSERDGFRCLRAQRLDPATKRPVGLPIDVYHFHGARRSLFGAGDPVNVNPAIAVDKVVFGMLETTGNIWMTDLAN